MDTARIVSDEAIEKALNSYGWDCCIDEGRLMLLELLSKAAAGFYNSSTEEGFLCSFGLMRRDRTPNKQGHRFIMSMVYASSNRRPFCFKLMKKHRQKD